MNCRGSAIECSDWRDVRMHSVVEREFDVMSSSNRMMEWWKWKEMNVWWCTEDGDDSDEDDQWGHDDAISPSVLERAV